jgi:hypothetical protein
VSDDVVLQQVRNLGPITLDDLVDWMMKMRKYASKTDDIPASRAELIERLNALGRQRLVQLGANGWEPTYRPATPAAKPQKELF